MTTVPTFAHPVFEQLYQKDYFIDDAVVREILALGPEAAVPELLKITDATLADFNYDDPDADWHDSYYFLHALYLLHELQAPEALDVYQRFLRLSAEQQEYWFGDWIFEELPALLAAAGQSRPAELMALLEDGTYSLQSRLPMGEALAQLARQHPKLRPDISAFFQRYLRYIIDHAAQAQELFPPDDELYGYELADYLGLLLANLQDADLRELEPEIRELYRLGLVDESISGSEEHIRFGKARPLQPLDTIFVRYRALRNDPDSYSPFHPNAAAIAERKARELKKTVKNLNDFRLNRAATQSGLIEPIIGRNDPCFCGSGKKYKKCCMA